MGGETDQVRWRGIRPVNGIRGIWPAIDSVRVNVADDKTGTGVSILYTVPANKILFIASGFLTSRLAVDRTARSAMFIRDDNDVDKFPILYNIFDIAGQTTIPVQYKPALQIIQGWDVYLYNSAPEVDCRGAIFGWLEGA